MSSNSVILDLETPIKAASYTGWLDTRLHGFKIDRDDPGQLKGDA